MPPVVGNGSLEVFSGFLENVLRLLGARSWRRGCSSCAALTGVADPSDTEGPFPGQMKQRLCPLLIIFATSLVLPVWGMVRAALPKP